MESMFTTFDNAFIDFVNWTLWKQFSKTILFQLFSLGCIVVILKDWLSFLLSGWSSGKIRQEDEEMEDVSSDVIEDAGAIM